MYRTHCHTHARTCTQTTRSHALATHTHTHTHTLTHTLTHTHAHNTHARATHARSLYCIHSPRPHADTHSHSLYDTHNIRTRQTQVAQTFANSQAGHFLPADFKFGKTDNALMDDINATLKGLSASSNGPGVLGITT